MSHLECSVSPYKTISKVLRNGTLPFSFLKFSFFLGIFTIDTKTQYLLTIYEIIKRLYPMSKIKRKIKTKQNWITASMKCTCKVISVLKSNTSLLSFKMRVTQFHVFEFMT